MLHSEVEADRPTVKIDHIAIAVDNLDSAIELYCGALGLELLERRVTTGKSTGMVSAVLDGAGIPIVLVQGNDPQSQVTRFVNAKGAGVQHVAFRIDSLESGIEKLAEQGIEPAIPVIEGDGIRQVFMAADDRSGPRLELIERNGGTFNEQSIEQLFLAFEERDLY